jgi:hypothetical protein
MQIFDSISYIVLNLLFGVQNPMMMVNPVSQNKLIFRSDIKNPQFPPFKYVEFRYHLAPAATNRLKVEPGLGNLFELYADIIHHYCWSLALLLFQCPRRKPLRAVQLN